MRWSNGEILNCTEAAIISHHNELPPLGLASKSLDKVCVVYTANTFRRLSTHGTSHWGYFRPKPVLSAGLHSERSESSGYQPFIRETSNS